MGLGRFHILHALGHERQLRRKRRTAKPEAHTLGRAEGNERFHPLALFVLEHAHDRERMLLEQDSVPDERCAAV